MKSKYPIIITILSAVIISCIFWWWCSWRWCSGPLSTVLLVRHAEKAALPEDDPPLLDPAGRDRADVLAHVAAKAGVSAIFTSTKLRSIKTAAPLETALGIGHQEFDLDDTSGLADAIKAAPAGQTVLVVSHSTKLPILIRLLGGPSIPNVDELEFDNLFVLTTRRWGNNTLVKLQYGAPSP